MCDRGLFAQCETTQNVEMDKGASLFGYTKMWPARSPAARRSESASRMPTSAR